MTSVTLDDLPRPPGGRSGWPWTEASRPLPQCDEPTASHGRNISIVTPSFNQAAISRGDHSIWFSCKAIRISNISCIDGGSTDGSVEILRRYDAFLDGWVSERDKGQSDAINKGFARCTGEVVNWLCSDDVLLAGALSQVGQAFVERPADGTYSRPPRSTLRRWLRAGFRQCADGGRSGLASGVE